MKHLFLLSVITFILAGCDSANGTDDKNKADSIDTAGQVNIPGTKVYIVPPKNFKVAADFPGLELDDKTGFQVMDLPGGNYYANAASFTKFEFQRQGIAVFEYKELTVNGYPAKYVYTKTDQSTKSYSLVFGDSTFSVMIIAAYPANDDTLGNAIKKALLSVTYDKTLKVDPLFHANFQLDNNASTFKFARAAGGVYLYSIGGAVKDSYEEEPMVSVTSLPADPTMTAKLLAGNMTAGLESYGLTNKEVKNESTTSINGYDTYECEVYGNVNGQQTLIYQLAVMQGDKAVVFQGVTKSDFENNAKEFRKLSHTIRFK